MAGIIYPQRDRVFVALVIMTKSLDINISFDCRYISATLTYNKIGMLLICGLQPCANIPCKVTIQTEISSSRSSYTYLIA